ncbi:MAG TPA: hypothetical protein VGA27_03740 [Candidatus Binatia bacterium]
MKFAESFKILTTTSPGAFARALRTIGQDLSDLFPETVEIEIRGENFNVRGQCAKVRMEAREPKQARKGLKDFCIDLLARDVTSRPAKEKVTTIEFSRTYTSEDINRLDAIGMGRRFGVGKTPDIRSLAEILRTIGRLIDGQGHRLVKIYKDSRRVTFEYVDSEGKTCNEMVNQLDLHKLQKAFYEKRGDLVGLDPWKDRKFPGRE